MLYYINICRHSIRIAADGGSTTAGEGALHGVSMHAGTGTAPQRWEIMSLDMLVS